MAVGEPVRGAGLGERERGPEGWPRKAMRQLATGQDLEDGSSWVVTAPWERIHCPRQCVPWEGPGEGLPGGTMYPALPIHDFSLQARASLLLQEGSSVRSMRLPDHPPSGGSGHEKDLFAGIGEETGGARGGGCRGGGGQCSELDIHAFICSTNMDLASTLCHLDLGSKQEG